LGSAPDSTSDILPQQLRGLLYNDDDVGQRKANKKPPKKPSKKTPPRRPPPKKRPPSKKRPPPPRKPTRPPPRSPIRRPPPSPAPLPPSSPINSACSITIDSVTTNFKTCIEMKDRSNRPIGTAGFSFSSSSQNELIIGFKAASSTPGWAALGYSPNGGMIGTDTVFAQSCGGTCVEGYSKALNGYAFQAFGPSKVDFREIKAGKDANGFLQGTAKMNWPGSTDSIFMTMASGPVGGGSPQIHFGVPRVVTLTKSDLA